MRHFVICRRRSQNVSIHQEHVIYVRWLSLSLSPSFSLCWNVGLLWWRNNDAAIAQVGAKRLGTERDEAGAAEADLHVLAHHTPWILPLQPPPTPRWWRRTRRTAPTFAYQLSREDSRRGGRSSDNPSILAYLKINCFLTLSALFISFLFFLSLELHVDSESAGKYLQRIFLY